MELRHLRYLATVVDERSVSRAAERLGMTQPPLSSAIQQVERRVGTPLLVRHARGVEPTEAGAYLAQEIRRILAHVESAVDRARDVGEGRVGLLSVAAMAAASWQWLPAVVGAFTRRSPQVEIQLSGAEPGEVIERVRDSRASVGLLYTSDSAQLANSAAAGLQTAVARREPLLVALPPGHRLAGSAVVDLAELTEEPWVRPVDAPTVPGIAALMSRDWARAGTLPRGGGTAASTAEALALVAGGGRIAALPASARSVAPAGVHLALARQPLGDLEATLVWRTGEPSAALRVFLAAALAAPEPDQLGAHLARSVAHEGDDGPDAGLPRLGEVETWADGGG